MREVQYQDFSWNTHGKNWQEEKPSVCQFELTYKCGLHCCHCYSDCFNQPPDIKKELKTEEIKLIIERLYKLGVLWLCFTGGDPLTRKDFLEIYASAKKKGFLITIFTTGYALNKEIVDYLVGQPPFVIEITLNAADKKTYEAITGVKDSFEKTLSGLELILKKNLPLKVKTLVTQQNYRQLPQLKAFLEARKLKFRPATLIHARLNGDKSPAELRLAPQEIFALEKLMAKTKEEQESERDFLECDLPLKNTPLPLDQKKSSSPRLFSCAAGSKDGINLDPYGRMFFCHCLRQPAIDFLASDLSEIKKTIQKEFPRFAQIQYQTASKCRSCELIDFCLGCPGRRFLETGNPEAPVEYFCHLPEALGGGENLSPLFS